jgi:hypothetical protein
MLTTKKIVALVFFVILNLSLTGCMPSVGRPFPVEQVRQIEIGKTTKSDVRQMFGDPWRTGIEDGYRTYTYGEYSVNNSRDLVIRFDNQEIVKSYSFSSSFPLDEGL